MSGSPGRTSMKTPLIVGSSMLTLVTFTWLVVSADDKPNTKAKREAVKRVASAKVDSAKVEIEIITNGVGMKLVKIPAGSFRMGSEHGFDDEVPVHKVVISKPFFLGVTEVTQGQYEAIMDENPSQNLASSDHPVDSVPWLKAVEFCEKLSEREGVKYRLPTEAEWEYACRAGGEGKIGLGEGGVEVAEDNIDEYAWLRLNSDSTQSVGQKKPNAWGLY